MKKPHRYCRELQLELFHPPRKGPQWRALPMDVRERARLLLAQMLRMSSVRYDSAETKRAARDE